MPRIALIGCGRWGSLILRDLRALGCDVVAVVRSEASRQRALAGGAAVVSSVNELPSVSGIVVATTTVTHAAVIQSVIDRNVPIFVEKPLAPSAQDAASLRRVGDGRVFVMDKWRYHPGIRELARIAGSGELGDVLGLQTLRLGWGHPHRDVDAIWILAPHDLSIGLEVLGRVLPARAAVAEVVDGVPVGLTGICGDAPWHVLEVSARRTANQRAVRLLCQGGIAELTDSYADHVVITRGVVGTHMAAPEPEMRPIPHDMPLLAELEAFVGHLAGGPPPSSSVDEGAAIVEVLTDLRQKAGLDGR